MVSNGFSIVKLLQETFSETSKGISNFKYLLINIATAVIEVLLMIYSFSLGFDALGIELYDSWTCSSLILGFSAFAAVALPPSYGAGPAAASIFVLSMVGVSEEYALAYSTIWWLISQVPAALFGVPSVWLIKEKK